MSEDVDLNTESLEQLSERYVKAANALSRYRRSCGFNPGVRVRCQWRDEPEQFGVIAEYGDAWYRCDSMHVSVRLDSGRTELWDMRHITKLPEAARI